MGKSDTTQSPLESSAERILRVSVALGVNFRVAVGVVIFAATGDAVVDWAGSGL